MKLCSYKEILRGVWDAMGWATDPSDPGEPMANGDEWHSAKRAISKAFERVYQESDWRDLVRVERRHFTADYSNTTVYDEGSFVYFPPTGRYYQSLVSTTGNYPATIDSAGVWSTALAYWSDASTRFTQPWWSASKSYVQGDRVTDPTTNLYYQSILAPPVATPVSNATYWGQITEFDPVVEWTQANQTPIGRVFQVYKSDPLRFRGAPKVEWFESQNGIQIQVDRVRGDIGEVWVRFLAPPARFTGDLWSATATYVPESDLAPQDPPVTTIQQLYANPGALAAVTVSGSITFVLLLEDAQTPTPATNVWFVRQASVLAVDGVNVCADASGATFIRV